MERVAQLAAHFQVPAMVCVNKADLNITETEAVESYAEKKGLTLVGRVPFDPVFTKAMVQGQTIFEYAPDSDCARAVSGIWERVMRRLGH